MLRSRVFLYGLVVSCASIPAYSLDFRDVLPQVVEKARVREFSVQFDGTTNAGQIVALLARDVAGVFRITAPTGSSYVEAVLAENDPDDRPAVLEALLAHEIGLCDDRHRSHSHRGASDAMSASASRGFAWCAASGALMLGPPPDADLWSETLADADMGAYLHRWQPQSAQRVMSVLLDRRARFAHVDPGHNSARIPECRVFWSRPGGVADFHSHPNPRKRLFPRLIALNPATVKS